MEPKGNTVTPVTGEDEFNICRVGVGGGGRKQAERVFIPFRTIKYVQFEP